jgi:hypothetical protein
MVVKSSKTQKNKIPLINFSKFRGKEVAIVDGVVVVQDDSSREAFNKARKLFPKRSTKDIILLSVPKEKVFVYSL